MNHRDIPCGDPNIRVPIIVVLPFCYHGENAVVVNSHNEWWTAYI